MSSSRTGSTYEASMREKYAHEADDRHKLEDERVHAAHRDAWSSIGVLARDNAHAEEVFDASLRTPEKSAIARNTAVPTSIIFSLLVAKAVIK